MEDLEPRALLQQDVNYKGSLLPSKTPVVNIVGDVFCDIFCSQLPRLPQLGEDVLASIKLVPGGGALNSVSHAAKYIHFHSDLGPVAVALFSMVGNDAQGKLCRSHLASLPYGAGIVQDRCRVATDGTATGSCVVLSGEGDRCFVTDRGAIGRMTVVQLDRQAVLSGSHLHIAGFYNLSCICADPSSLQELLREAQERGITTSLNPQHDATDRWGSMHMLAPYLDVLICSEGEMVRMAAVCKSRIGCGIDDSAGGGGGGGVDNEASRQGGNCSNNADDSQRLDTQAAASIKPTTPATPSHFRSSSDTASAAGTLLAAGARCVVCTCAERGAVVYWPCRSSSSPSIDVGISKNNPTTDDGTKITSGTGVSDTAYTSGSGAVYDEYTTSTSITSTSSARTGLEGEAEEMSIKSHLIEPTSLGNRPVLDTTGAGDAFAGVFLADFVANFHDASCYAASHCRTNTPHHSETSYGSTPFGTKEELCRGRCSEQGKTSAVEYCAAEGISNGGNNRGHKLREMDENDRFLRCIIQACRAGSKAGAAAITVLGGSNTSYSYW